MPWYHETMACRFQRAILDHFDACLQNTTWVPGGLHPAPGPWVWPHFLCVCVCEWVPVCERVCVCVCVRACADRSIPQHARHVASWVRLSSSEFSCLDPSMNVSSLFVTIYMACIPQRISCQHPFGTPTSAVMMRTCAFTRKDKTKHAHSSIVLHTRFWCRGWCRHNLHVRNCAAHLGCKLDILLFLFRLHYAGDSSLLSPLHAYSASQKKNTSAQDKRPWFPIRNGEPSHCTNACFGHQVCMCFNASLSFWQFVCVCEYISTCTQFSRTDYLRKYWG
jgi:hypothetical protein